MTEEQAIAFVKSKVGSDIDVGFAGSPRYIFAQHDKQVWRLASKGAGLETVAYWLVERILELYPKAVRA